MTHHPTILLLFESKVDDDSPDESHWDPSGTCMGSVNTHWCLYPKGAEVVHAFIIGNGNMLSWSSWLKMAH